MERNEDPDNSFNSAVYHTGFRCIEPGCWRPAGTAWSYLWCQPCNAARMKRITLDMNAMRAALTAQAPEGEK